MRRLRVAVACLAKKSPGTASYAVYSTDTAKSARRKLSFGGSPCDDTQYANSLGRLRTGIRIAFSKVPPHTTRGYAIVVPER